MMSDKEFLDGIYKKAKEASRKEKEERHTFFSPRRLAPALLLCILAAVAIPVFSHLYREGQNPPSTVQEPDPASLPLPLEQDGRSAPDIQGRLAPIPASFILYGTVTEAGHTGSEWKVRLQIKTAYAGEAAEEITFTCPDESGFTFEEGEEGLYYVEERDGGYILSNGDYGKYTYVGEENGCLVFEARDGSRITSDILEPAP